MIAELNKFCCWIKVCWPVSVGSIMARGVVRCGAVNKSVEMQQKSETESDSKIDSHKSFIPGNKANLEAKVPVSLRKSPQGRSCSENVGKQAQC